MKTFKQYLTEEQSEHSVLQSITDNANKPPVFLTPSVMKRLKFSVENVTAYHITSYQSLPGLVKIQNKKSAQISVLTNTAESDMLKQGVETSGGVVARVTGDIAAYFNKDAWTARTKGGRRSILIADPNRSGTSGTFTGAMTSAFVQMTDEQEAMMRSLLKGLHDDLVEARLKAFDKAFKGNKINQELFRDNSRIYKEFRATGKMSDGHELSLYVWLKDAETSKTIGKEVKVAERTFVKSYMDEMEKVLASNPKYKVLFNHEPLTNFMNANSLYDEGVISNFSIEKVYIINRPGGFTTRTKDNTTGKLMDHKDLVRSETGLTLSNENIRISHDYGGQISDMVFDINKDMDRNLQSFTEVLAKHFKS